MRRSVELRIKYIYIITAIHTQTLTLNAAPHTNRTPTIYTINVI